MKLWLPSLVLVLATACSHGGAKTSEPAAPAAAQAAPKPVKKDAAKAASVAEHTTCTSGQDERIIDIVAKGQGCAVEYTKMKEKKEIASAEHSPAHCRQVAQKVRGRLEAAGFACK
jgi:hypothetical protein